MNTSTHNKWLSKAFTMLFAAMISCSPNCEWQNVSYNKPHNNSKTNSTPTIFGEITCGENACTSLLHHSYLVLRNDVLFEDSDENAGMLLSTSLAGTKQLSAAVSPKVIQKNKSVTS